MGVGNWSGSPNQATSVVWCSTINGAQEKSTDDMVSTKMSANAGMENPASGNMLPKGKRIHMGVSCQINDNKALLMRNDGWRHSMHSFDI